MKLLFTILVLITIVSCSSNGYVGNELTQFRDAPDNPVSIHKAIEIARPYLDQTFKLRLDSRNSKNTKEPIITVTLKGDWYYIVKDNYPSYSPGFYTYHAVKVNKNTGELIEPK